MNTYAIYRVPYGHLIELKRDRANIVYALAQTAGLIAALCVMFYVSYSFVFCAYNASVGCILFCLAMLRTAYELVSFYLWALFGSESILIAKNRLVYTKNYRWFKRENSLEFNGISTEIVSKGETVKSACLTFKTDEGTLATNVSLPRPQADKIAKRINAYHYAA